MKRDVSNLSDQKLDALLRNHRRLSATDKPSYAEAMIEWDRRNCGELRVETSIAYLRTAVAEGRFVSYSELAGANGLGWDKARYPMFAHLGCLVDYGLRQGWPMLSAIVVNKQHLGSGEMDAATLTGFIQCARDFSLPVGEEREFLKQQQEAVFAWGTSSV